MRFSLLVLALLPVLAGAGCSRSTDPSPVAASPARPDDPLAALQLDGGKRWASDDHTRKSIAAMTAAMQDAASDMAPAATTALGKRLQELGNELIAGCTMKGPEHDALHMYLGALLPALQTMAGADAAAARAARQEVTTILGRFGDYFQ